MGFAYVGGIITHRTVFRTWGFLKATFLCIFPPVLFTISPSLGYSKFFPTSLFALPWCVFLGSQTTPWYLRPRDSFWRRRLACLSTGRARHRQTFWKHPYRRIAREKTLSFLHVFSLTFLFLRKRVLLIGTALSHFRTTRPSQIPREVIFACRCRDIGRLPWRLLKYFISGDIVMLSECPFLMCAGLFFRGLISKRDFQTMGFVTWPLILNLLKLYPIASIVASSCERPSLNFEQAIFCLRWDKSDVWSTPLALIWIHNMFSPFCPGLSDDLKFRSFFVIRLLYLATIVFSVVILFSVPYLVSAVDSCSFDAKFLYIFTTHPVNAWCLVLGVSAV